MIAFSSFYQLASYIDYLEKSDAQQNKYLILFWPVIEKLINVIPTFWIFYSVLVGYSGNFFCFHLIRVVPNNNICFYFTQLGQLRQLFSSRFFIPWSRLSFTLIMCQFTFLLYALGSTRTIFPFNRMTGFKETFSGYIFTFIFGNFLFLFFDGPMTNIFKHYFGIKKRSELISEPQSKKAL